MTEKDINEDNKYKFVEKKSFFNSIFTYLVNLYLKYFMNISVYSNINIIENTQSFFIPNDIQERVYQVPPHKKFSIGPIIFKPNKKGNINATLFLKNNLTILFPLKLKGEGGSGNIKFLYNNKNDKKSKLHDEKNFIIEIDENIYEKEIKGYEKLNRTITLMNDGNLPMTIKNITIDNSNECQTSNMRIIQCKEVILNPQEIINIDIEIIPNYRYNLASNIISFNTEFKSFYLNTYIIFSKDFYESQNHIRIFFKCLLIVTPILAVMLYSLSKIINIFKKQRREMCDKSNDKEEIENEKDEKKEKLIKNNDIIIGKVKNNDNENDQLEYNNNYQQNKAKQKQNKKKRNRKKSNASYNQKDEIEVISNNNNIIKKDNQNKNKINNSNNNDINSNNLNEIKEENKNENNNNNSINNKIIGQEKNGENKNKVNNNQNELDEKKVNNDIDLKNNNDNKNKKENKKKGKINKESLKLLNKNEAKENDSKEKDYDKEILSDRIEFKRDNKNENISEEKKNIKSNEKKKITYEQRIKSNDNKKRSIDYENEIIENNNPYNNNNYYNNNKYQNKYRGKIRRDINNKKYYSNNRRYNNYDNNQNNNIYNNTYQQQPKKQITKIKKENNAKNLKELLEHSKRVEVKEVEISNSKKKSEEKKELIQENDNLIINNKNSSKNINLNNNNIINDNNISNIKSANDEGIEDDLEEELFGSKKQKEFLNYQFPITKKLLGNEKIEEMHPTFLNDIKTNNFFEAEQELMKTMKKESKDIKDTNMSNNNELSKGDSEMDFNNSNFNFNFFFFDQPKEENEDIDSCGNYEDFKYKSIIDNLNPLENPFTNEEEKGKLDLLLNNNNNVENEDKKYENEEHFKENSNDNDFNFFDCENNYDNSNEEKKFQNKFEDYQKIFGKFGKK